MNKECDNKGNMKKITDGFRNSKLGPVPNDWHDVLFGEMFEEISLTTDETEKYPLYSLTIENGVTPKTERYERSFLITKEENNYKVVNKNEFVYNPMNLRFGALARHIEDKSVSVSGYYNVFKISNGYSPEFIEQYLKSERMMYLYNSVATGSLKEKQRVHYSQFIELKLPMPPKEEAYKIGKILSTWEKAIELKEKYLEQRKIYNRELMQNLLTGLVRVHELEKLTYNDVKNRIQQIKEDQIPNGYKNTKIGVIPTDWNVVSLKDKFDRIVRRNYSNCVNVLTISGKHGLVSQESFFTKNVASSDVTNYFLIKKGEFAYNKSSSNGYPYGAIKMLEKYEEGILSPLYICFRPNDNNDNPDFYRYYFEVGLLNREIHAIAQEGARNHGLLNMSVDDFFDTYIPDFDKQEQERICEILTYSENAIKLLDEEVCLLKKQKKGLMQLLLTGKTRVS